MNERKLVENIILGHKKSVNLFYKTYQQKIFKYILRKVSNKKDAEELLQDVFISAFDSLPIFRFDASLYTWLRTIASHEIIDFYRKRKIKTLVFSRLPFIKKIVSQALSPELAMQEKEMKQRIANTFRLLSEGYSKILRLKYIEGKSYMEIAKTLGKSVKAVESQLTRARLAFRKQYAKEYQSTINNQQSTKKIFSESFSLFLTSGH